MTRLTQIPVEVAIQRDFTSNARLTQIPVEVAIQRDFTSNARVSQIPVEVAINRTRSRIKRATFQYGQFFGYLNNI